MVVEKEIEAKVIEKLETALSGISGVSVLGTWQSSNVGEVKGIEDSKDLARIAVATGAPEYEGWTIPIANIPISIAVTVRQELAPTAAELSTIFGAVENVLVGWQLQAGSISDLTVNHFRADGVRLHAGDPPQFFSDRRCWKITRGLTVRGAIQQ